MRRHKPTGTVPNRGQESSPSGRRRREYQWAQVRMAAAKMGAGHTVQLIAVLSGLHQMAPTGAAVARSQRTLGKMMGRHERTARYQVAALVALGILVVYGAPAQQMADGRWERSVNRYRPAVDAARRLLEHGSALVAPRGNGRPHSHPVGCDQHGAVPSSTPPPPHSGAPPPVEPAAVGPPAADSNPVGALPPDYLAARAALVARRPIRRP